MLEKLEQLQKELNVIYLEVSELAKDAEMAHDSDDDKIEDILWIQMIKARITKQQLNYAINNLSEAITNLQEYFII